MGIDGLQSLGVGAADKILASMEVERPDDNRHGTHLRQDLLHTFPRLSKEVTDLRQLLWKHRVGVVEDESQLNLVGITLILRSIGLNRVMLLLQDRDLMKDIRSTEYEDFHAWNILIDREADNAIELSWGEIVGLEDALHLIINGEAINMHEEQIIMINSMIEEVAIVVGNVDSYLNPIPEEFGLNAAYPNPFNPTTTLGLALNVDGHVSMSVFNIRGQVVEVLVDRNMKAGYHNITWNADGVSSGMYFVRAETGTNAAIQKLMLLK